GRGVRIALAASFNEIGGTTAGAGNRISGNRGEGVALTDTDTTRNEVAGNTIGTNAAGTAALGNGQGVRIALGASFNQIGGTAAGARNLISANRGEGVPLTDAGPSAHPLPG